jgi:YHS domain-containing protein
VLRFVALAVLACLIFLILRASIHAFLRGLRGGGHPRPMRRAGLDELVKDPVCETYIPRQKAIARGSGPDTRFFCSVACAEKFARS